MERITKRHIQYRINVINKVFETLGKNTTWTLQGRNGYEAIDSGPADGHPGENVCAGCNKRELYDQLGIAIKALDVVGREPMPNRIERVKKEQERLDAIEVYNNRIAKYRANLEEADVDPYSI